MNKPLASQAPVCVTGASGFIASRLVADLLQQGYRVRGTVRDASQAAKYSFLTELPGATDRLELVSADLLAPESFEDAVAGCEYVMHTASPYVLTAKDPDKELVQPALRGTEGVLAACAKVGGVKRVVLTSSVAALTDEPQPGEVLTEEDWNEKSSLTRNPYYFSKVKAERAAWKFMEDQSPDFDLVVINPFMVYGPSLSKAINTSNQVFIDLLTGVFPGIINISWSLVDVRDVAQAHILAMETPTASGRHLCAHNTIGMRELVALLAELGYRNYKLPKLSLDNGFGNLLVRLASLFQPAGVRSYLKTNLNRVPNFDNSKIKSELGLEFRDFESSLSDTILDLIQWKHIPDIT